MRATMPARDGPRRVSPMELADRSIRENSEFLIGSVLVNVIFPESMGSSEDWTDDEIAGAMSGIALGISQYMQKALWFNDLSFIYNYSNFKRVPVAMEPIESDMSTDDIWIGEVLANLNYTDGAYMGSHALNNATRNAFKTDWVFTAFIADMSNHYSATPPSPDPGCWGRGRLRRVLVPRRALSSRAVSGLPLRLRARLRPRLHSRDEPHLLGARRVRVRGDVVQRQVGVSRGFEQEHALSVVPGNGAVHHAEQLSSLHGTAADMRLHGRGRSAFRAWRSALRRI